MIKGAGILFLSPQGNALFLKRSGDSDYPGHWCFPGGGSENGETAEQTAVREAIEEIGFLPKGERELHARQISGSSEVSPGTAAVAGAGPQPLPAETPAPVAIQPKPVDFTTFVQQVPEQFEPKINDEHVGFAWAPVKDPPEPLHPGCRVALNKLSMNELGVARAIMTGELTSPQQYANVALFAIRVTGTGVSYRSNDEEFVVRDPKNYLNDEFLARCNGLPVIFEHPEKATLDTKEFTNRVVGSVFLPYISGDEIWAIAKIHDATAARIMTENQLSTSPTVVFRNPKATNTKVELEDGSVVLFEGDPALLDHVAIVPHGVWDKGNEPNGVKTETRSDSAMTEEERKAADAAKHDAEEKEKAEREKVDKAKADAEAKAKADAEGGTELDKVLKGVADAMGSIVKRMDAFEEKEKAKADAEAKAKTDAEEEEKKKADKAKADAEEEARKKGDPKQMEADKAKKDAEEKEEREKAKADAEATRKKIADLEKKLEPRADTDVTAMTDAQAKADAVYSMFGKHAPRPLQGEELIPYRRRMLNDLKVHSENWKGVDLAAVADFGRARDDRDAGLRRRSARRAQADRSPGRRASPDRHP